MAAPEGSAEETLTPAWRQWVVGNLLQGASHGTITAALVSRGVPRDLAAREVAATAASPLLATCAHLTAAVERRDQLLSLLGAHREAAAVERRTTVEGDELFTRYWATSTPLILTEQIADWPALRTWSLATFRERVGAETVEVCTGRSVDPHCDRNFADHLETMTMERYLDQVEAAGVTNDLYMIAHNRTMERVGMATLLDDVVVDDSIFDPSAVVGGCTLWVGPAGTRTPLHHDSTNILFCQIVGRKRFWLIPPWEGSLLDDADGYYARFDPAAPRDTWPPEHADAVLHEFVLEAGEALFLPAGWWHQVDALDPSISFSLLCFRRPNAFDDYAPGKVRVQATHVESAPAEGDAP